MTLYHITDKSCHSFVFVSCVPCPKSDVMYDTEVDVKTQNGQDSHKPRITHVYCDIGNRCVMLCLFNVFRETEQSELFSDTEVNPALMKLV